MLNPTNRHNYDVLSPMANPANIGGLPQSSEQYLLRWRVDGMIQRADMGAIALMRDIYNANVTEPEYKPGYTRDPDGGISVYAVEVGAKIIEQEVEVAPTAEREIEELALPEQETVAA